MSLRCAQGAITRGERRRECRIWGWRAMAALAALLFLASCSRPEVPADSRTSHPPLQVAKNLLLIVVDTLRADFVGCYGGPVATPNLDRLARSGVRFTRAYSNIPVTGPSHASIFFGLTPLSHGVRFNAQAMSTATPTMAEVMLANGMRTGAVVSLGVLRSRFSFNRGFEFFDDTFESQWYRPAEEITDSALAMIGRWEQDDRFFAFVHYSDPHEPYAPPGVDYSSVEVDLDGTRLASVIADGRGVRIPLEFFPGHHEIRFDSLLGAEVRGLTFQQFRLTASNASLSLGTGWRGEMGAAPGRANRTVALPATLNVEVAGPSDEAVRCDLRFFVDENVGTREARRRYGLEVEYVDHELGRLLGELESRGYLRDTLVIVTSDHGEGLGDHGLMGHIHQLYDDLIRVPLIVVRPGGSDDAHVFEDVVSLIDLRPTVMTLLGIVDPTPGDGVDLSGVVWQQRIADHPVHYCMTFKPLANAELRGIVAGRFKLIKNEENGDIEFFDLQRDPGEQANLALSREASIAPSLADYLQALDSWLEMASGVESETMPTFVDEDDRSMLEALGYVQ